MTVNAFQQSDQMCLFGARIKKEKLTLMNKLLTVGKTFGVKSKTRSNNKIEVKHKKETNITFPKQTKTDCFTNNSKGNAMKEL